MELPHMNGNVAMNRKENMYVSHIGAEQFPMRRERLFIYFSEGCFIRHLRETCFENHFGNSKEISRNFVAVNFVY